MEHVGLALFLAKLAVLLILIAFSYFFFIKLTFYSRKINWAVKFVPVTQRLIPVSRSVHVYAGAAGGVVALIHVYIMLSILGIGGGKLVFSGIAAVSMFIIVILLGSILVRNRSNLRLRYWHRGAALTLGAALLIHLLI